MNYIVNRDISMVIYAAVVFAVVFAVYAVISRIRKKRIVYGFFASGLMLTAIWEFLYSAGSWWKHNNGLLGAYYMIAMPVMAVICSAVLTCIFGRTRQS